MAAAATASSSSSEVGRCGRGRGRPQQTTDQEVEYQQKPVILFFSLVVSPSSSRDLEAGGGRAMLERAKIDAVRNECPPSWFGWGQLGG